MDVVYFFKSSGGNSLELRYSLRSLINVEHHRVFIIGDIPKWCTNVVHIPFNDIEGKKYDNVGRKRRKLLALRSCSEDFLLMNDDFYILQPIEKFEYYIYSSLKEHYDTVSKSKVINNYSRALKTAYTEFPDGNDYETHTPFLLNKSKLAELIERKGDKKGATRTFYGNYHKLPGIYLPNTPDYRKVKHCCDCKIFSDDHVYVNEGQPFLSSSDHMIKSKKFLDLMDSFFPNKSQYEKNTPLLF